MSESQHRGRMGMMNIAQKTWMIVVSTTMILTKVTSKPGRRHPSSHHLALARMNVMARSASEARHQKVDATIDPALNGLEGPTHRTRIQTRETRDGMEILFCLAVEERRVASHARRGTKHSVASAGMCRQIQRAPRDYRVTITENGRGREQRCLKRNVLGSSCNGGRKRWQKRRLREKLRRPIGGTEGSRGNLT